MLLKASCVIIKAAMERLFLVLLLDFCACTTYTKTQTKQKVYVKRKMIENWSLILLLQVTSYTYA